MDAPQRRYRWHTLDFKTPHRAMQPLELETLKAGLNLLVAVTTLGLGWVVGNKLSAYWNHKQRQREFDLVSANDFHRLYGEFFAIWKIWNLALNEGTQEPKGRDELFGRACNAEGEVESLFVRLASNRALTSEQAATLGRFRQGYQTLRQSIRDRRKLGWDSSSHREYVAFKTLATDVAALIANEKGLSRDEAKRRAASLIRITSNGWESKWIEVDSSMQVQ